MGALEAGQGPSTSEEADIFTRSAHGPIACGSFRRVLAEKRRGVHALQVKMEIEMEEAERRAKERDMRKKRSADAMALMRAAMKANTAGIALVQRASQSGQGALALSTCAA